VQISATSNSSNKLYDPTTTKSSSSSNAIQLLEKQKSQLQEQMSKLNGQKMDPKEKMDKQKEIQDQIN
jgi:hypothetical protein